MKRIDLNKFEKCSNFYNTIDLLLTVKSFDLQAIRKRYLDSKKNNRSGSTSRREIAVGGVVSLSLNNGKLIDEKVLTKLKEPRGIDFSDNKLAISSENIVYLIGNKIESIRNDFFSYIHTVSFSPFDINKLLISSSGFDCIFEYDLKNVNPIWEWFAWENGFPNGKDSQTNSDVFITRDKLQAQEWERECKSFILIDNPKEQNLPTAQRSAFINSVSYHQDKKDFILATLFHKGVLLQINKNDNSSNVIIDNMHHPHGGKGSNAMTLATSTNSGEVVCVQEQHETRYFFNNLPGKPIELGEMEWLQNSILVNEMVITIDSNRKSFIIFDPIKKLYDSIPYDKDWAIQDMVCGSLDDVQISLLKEINLSI